LLAQVLALSSVNNLSGIGVDSGLPDYRSAEGFWKAYPPLVKQNLTLTDLSHPEWFEKDPESAWGFYGHRAWLYLSILYIEDDV
jgi:NAD-dependent SIR2 family protein deacetylase